jgi:hypothetical protein
VITICLTIMVVAFIAATCYESTRPEQPPAPHDCSIHGHNYQPAYDESGGQDIDFKLPQAGPFLSGAEVVRMVQMYTDALKAAGPHTRTYVHSVCTFCGLTVDRPDKK